MAFTITKLTLILYIFTYDLYTCINGIISGYQVRVDLSMARWRTGKKKVEGRSEHGMKAENDSGVL